MKAAFQLMKSVFCFINVESFFQVVGLELLVVFDALIEGGALKFLNHRNTI